MSTIDPADCSQASRTPDDLVVRPLEARDIDAAVDIAVAAWEPIYAGYAESMGPALFARLFGDDWRAEKAGQVANGAAAHPERFLVSELDGTVVGFASWRFDRERAIAEIGNNAVHPQWQGRRIAGAMYARMLDIFREEGMAFAYVQTGGDPAHAPAVKAYQKAGLTIREDVVRLYRKL